MAFNPFGTFQKNRRFWMAAILMVCMISFVFCTGLKGDMAERFIALFGHRGTTVFSVDGRGVTSRDLHELRMQRNLANDFIKVCADMAYKKLAQELSEASKKGLQNQDDLAKRKAALFQMQKMQATLAMRKSRPRYFDIGVSKFDDLVEFKLWQAEADRMGIIIDEKHLSFLFRMEFFDVLKNDELVRAQSEAARNAQNANNAMVLRAIAEEFRVKIARLAVMGSQPYSFLFRRANKDAAGEWTLKFDDPSKPDQTRAPLTLAQVFDAFKEKRSEFDEVLIPVFIEKWVKDMPAPNDIQQRDFFEANKNKANDPGSEYYGLETPAQAKFEYLYADPESPAYLGLAKTMAQLKAASPFAFDVVQSPLADAARVVAAHHKDRADLQGLYDSISKTKYHGAAMFSQKDCVSPILSLLANRHPESLASMIGAAALSPWNPLDAQGAVAGHLAWGALKHPAEVDAAVRSEVRRRVPLYKDFLVWGPTQFPLNLAAPFLAMDKSRTLKHEFGFFFSELESPLYTLETVENDLKDMLARRTAEHWAQENMAIAQEELTKANGSDEKYKRVLRKIVPELKLTYGPAADAKLKYYNRFTIEDAKAFDVLKKGYLKYLDMINMFEGRDLTPGRLLKESDYDKMFFDATERFAATDKYRAMPWPPEVTPSLARARGNVDPRLIKQQNIDLAEMQRFDQHLAQADPNKQAPSLDLFKHAAMPILFWRTADLPPNRPADFAHLGKDLQKCRTDLKKIDQEIKNAEKDTGKVAELRRKAVEVKQIEADLKIMQERVTQGWKLKESRETKALPRAREIALRLVDKRNNPETILEESAKLDTSRIVLPKLSLMHPEYVGERTVDYFLPPLPKDKIAHPPEDMLQPNGKIAYPRDDMVKQLLSLHDMKGPIQIGYPKLDEINKELFDRVAKGDHPQGMYVQILTNMPRTAFYVAAITSQPQLNRESFTFAMFGAPYPLTERGGMRDHFVDRIQDAEAKQYSEQLVAALRVVHRYSLDNEGLKKEFDERAPGD